MRALLSVLAALLGLALWAMSSSGHLAPPGPVMLEEAGMKLTAGMERPPSRTGTPSWHRNDDGTVTASVRLKFDCPVHVFNTASWIVANESGIVLCNQPLKNTDAEDRLIYGPCPQDLMVEYRISGMPADEEPVFSYDEHCPAQSMQDGGS